VSFLQAVVLGIVQGLTEFLPISSSGHLRIVPELFGWEDPGAAFTAVIQLGTVAAVLLYFRKDLWKIAVTWLRSLRDRELRSTIEARMGWYLIVATIPIVIFGVVFKDQIETGARNLWIIGTTLIVGGLILYAADQLGRRTRNLDHLTTRDGILIGVAQSAALVPGVSRSGATISAGLFLGYDRESAARFSFLLSIPAVVLSGLYELRKVGEPAEKGFAPNPGVAPTIVATVLAFVVGYIAIAWLLRYLVSHSLTIFVIYRLAVGTLVLVLLATGTINAR
jgi:undecaprenyl-diphosphatase